MEHLSPVSLGNMVLGLNVPLAVKNARVDTLLQANPGMLLPQATTHLLTVRLWRIFRLLI